MTAGASDAETPELGPYRRALSRPPRPEEERVLTELLAKHRAKFAQDPADAKKLLSVGDWPAPEKTRRPPSFAAWTSVARVILNPARGRITRELTAGSFGGRKCRSMWVEKTCRRGFRRRAPAAASRAATTPPG